MSAAAPRTDYAALTTDAAVAARTTGLAAILGDRRPELALTVEPDDSVGPGAHGEPDEPLVVLEGDESLLPLNAYRWAGWPGTTDAVWLRRSVIERLRRAVKRLPEGFGFAVFDGWRSPETVRALYDHYYGPGSTLPPGFLADPDDVRTAPPHETGGAVDLTLTWQGAPLALGTPFDEFSPRARRDHFEFAQRQTDGHADAQADVAAIGDDRRLVRDLRRLLTATLVDVGFAPYDEEWWHVSFGDDAWAAFTGATAAPFGATRPPGRR